MMPPHRRTISSPIITLLTDFGQQDGYVGAMQGVILSICPTATLVTLSHDISPQDIQAAAFVLYQAFSYYPAHTVHCVVVDPGVGSHRRAIAVRTSNGIFVGPDNGVFTLVLHHTNVMEAVMLSNPEYQLPAVSKTFHGRDIFAPTAAYLASGIPLSELGPRAINLVKLETLARSKSTARSGESRIIHIDRFGNLILDLTADEIANPGQIIFTIGDNIITSLSDTFADVDEGQLLAYTGSSRDHIEIAVRNGNAARRLGVRIGDMVKVQLV
jgi:S-adenosylmethionine hydrolase